MCADVAFGITAASRPDHARFGMELERLGYRELWVNDTRRGDGIATLAEVRPGTSALRLAVGVVALSEHSVGDVAERLRAVDLPHDRLILGVGSGASSSLDLVREGVVGLRGLLPDVPIAVAAVGPRMLRLAGQVADVVVANWALPDRLSVVRDRVREGALAAGRREPRLVAYVRTAIGPEAARRLRDSMDQYRAYGGGHYARAFDEQPDALVGIAIESGDAAELAEALAPYRSVVDTVVVRGLPADDSVDGWLAVARASGRWGRQAS